MKKGSNNKYDRTKTNERQTMLEAVAYNIAMVSVFYEREHKLMKEPFILLMLKDTLDACKKIQKDLNLTESEIKTELGKVQITEKEYHKMVSSYEKELLNPRILMAGEKKKIEILTCKD